MFMKKSRMLALFLSVLMLCLTPKAFAAEPEYPLMMHRAGLSEFANKPIDIHGELTYTDKGVTSLKLSKTNIGLTVGQSYRIKITIKGTGEMVDPDSIAYTVSKPNLLALGPEPSSEVWCVIIALRSGKTKLTVSVGGKKASANVSIKKPAKGTLLLSSSMLSLLAGQSTQLTALVYPNSTPSSVSWTSSNKKIATVDAKGTITAKKKGSVTITAKKGKYTAKCAVRIESTPTAERYFAYSGDAYATITGYTGSAAHVIVPETLGGMRVQQIGSRAFSGNHQLKSIALPNSLLKIDERAFSDCINLENVLFPDSLIQIGREAFWRCLKLRNIELPNGLTTLQRGAFGECTYLREVVLPPNLTAVPAEAFKGCNGLRRVTLPNRITTIEEDAFADCTTLAEINMGSVTTIGSGAFRNCQLLERITLPPYLTTISSSMFSRCLYLESVEVGARVKTIERNAFESCEKLKKIVIPKNVTAIDATAFGGAANVTIYGEAGSYAQQFANTNGMPFVAQYR